MGRTSGRATAMRQRWAAGLTALALLPSQAPGTAAEPAKTMAYGRHLAQECASCHRLDGSDEGIPSIVGWPADRLAATLKLYQTTQRTNPVMVSVARSLNESQIEALAAYLGLLPGRKPRARGD